MTMKPLVSCWPFLQWQEPSIPAQCCRLSSAPVLLNHENPKVSPISCPVTPVGVTVLGLGRSPVQQCYTIQTTMSSKTDLEMTTTPVYFRKYIKGSKSERHSFLEGLFRHRLFFFFYILSPQNKRQVTNLLIGYYHQL